MVDISELIRSTFVALWSIYTLVITIHIINIDGDGDINVIDSIFLLKNIGHFIKTLFVDRNIFGIVLGVIVLVLSLPAILLCLFSGIIILFVYLLYRIWILGSKHK